MPAYPPPTGPAHGRRFSSDEDGDGPFEAAAEGVASANTALRACLLQHEAQASALDDHWQPCCGVSAEDGAVRLADALAGEMPGSAEAFAKEDERYFGPPTRDARAFAGTGLRGPLERDHWVCIINNEGALSKTMGLPIPEWFDPTQTRRGDGMLSRRSQAQ